MASNAAATSSSGQLRIEAVEVGYNKAENWSDISWALYLDETAPANSSWTGAAISSSVLWNPSSSGLVALINNSFTYDWRGAGLQSTLISSGTNRMYHLAGGDASLYMEGRMGASGQMAAGGPMSVGVWVPLTLLKVLPGTPTNVITTYVSDTQLQINWNQSSASNGQPDNDELQYSINDTAYDGLLGISAANSTVISGWKANRKTAWRVRAYNAGAGYTAWSVGSNFVYTTPADPTNAVATKGTNLNIVVAFTSNVAYTEHEHQVWHGTVLAGATTWDSTPLATLASGILTYTHAAPDASKVHIYRVRSIAGALASGYSTTQSVQLLAPPNKPTVPAMAAVSDRSAALTLAWIHNPQDTTPQTAYEVSRSVDGGAAWTTSGKVASSAAQLVVAANAYAANVALTTRVRTWGSSTAGGADGTGASAWSDLRTVTYKTIPTASIMVPVNGSVLNDATIRVTVGFSQNEGATFVKTQLELVQGAVLIETLDSNIQVGIILATHAANGVSYTVRSRVQDSNGLWSGWVANTFSVTYLAPVPAGVTVSYLPDTGYSQLDLTIAAPGTGQSAATKVTITRTINGIEESVVKDYPVSAALTFLDTIPTIHGTNAYIISTLSAMGAQVSVTALLVTTECRRAYLSKGAGFSSVVAFGANLSVAESLGVASDTIQAAGRTKPIGLYGMETSVQLKVSSFLFEGFGSTIDQVRDILLLPGKACYRDGSGRRVFGSVNGSVSYKKATRGDLSFTLTETS